MSLSCSRLPHVTMVVGSPRVNVSLDSFWSPRLSHVTFVDGGPSSMGLTGVPKTRSRFFPQVITVEGCVGSTVLGGVEFSRLPQIVSLDGLASTGAESPRLTVCGCYSMSKSIETVLCGVITHNRRAVSDSNQGAYGQDGYESVLHSCLQVHERSLVL
jgi:hypothetical protein